MTWRALSISPYNKVDVYAFGLLLWEMVAIEVPFDGMPRQNLLTRSFNTF